MILIKVLSILFLVFTIIKSNNFTTGETLLMQEYQSPELEKSQAHSESKCELLDTELLPMCRHVMYKFNFKYEKIQFPNIMGHRSQKEASEYAKSYLPVIEEYNSNSWTMRRFLCAIFAPPCIDNSTLIKPCLELCEEAKYHFSYILNGDNYRFRPEMNCNSYPSSMLTDVICLIDNNNPRKYENLKKLNTFTGFERPVLNLLEKLLKINSLNLKTNEAIVEKLSILEKISLNQKSPIEKLDTGNRTQIGRSKRHANKRPTNNNYRHKRLRYF